MSEIKHTPGPWTVEPDMRPQFQISYGEEDRSEEYLAGWDVVSEVECIVGCEGIIPGNRSEANARLIAASPDMLEALKNIENDDNHIPATIWALVCAAIAKAEGREPDLT